MLVELLTVMALLTIVLTAIVGSFTTAMRHEAIATNQAQAYTNARLVLQRMRLDIHCAHSQSSELPVQQNPYGGFTLTLTESEGECPGVLPTGSGASGSSGAPSPSRPGTRHASSCIATTRRRYLPATAPGSTFEVDYIAQPTAGWPTNSDTTPTPTSWAGNIWPSAGSCATGGLPTVPVDLNIAINAANNPTEYYELADRIAVLNADPC